MYLPNTYVTCVSHPGSTSEDDLRDILHTLSLVCHFGILFTLTCVLQFLYEKGGVFIHTTVARADEDALVEGKVVITRKVMYSNTTGRVVKDT